MVKHEKTDQPSTTSEDGLDLNSHQDYSNWVITGNRYYIDFPNCLLEKDELEEVISVEGKTVFCEDCEQVRPSLKPTNNTPSFHASPMGICIECELKWIRQVRKEGLNATLYTKEIKYKEVI